MNNPVFTDTLTTTGDQWPSLSSKEPVCLFVCLFVCMFVCVLMIFMMHILSFQDDGGFASDGTFM